MATKITFKVDLAVEKGPSTSFTQDLSVDAYDLLKVKVPGGDNATPGTVTVDVQPGTTKQMKLLSLTSSLYDEKLTYKIDAGATDIPFDAPQLYVGGGSIGLLGATANKFVFTNKAGLTKEAWVQILVGRKATP